MDLIQKNYKKIGAVLFTLLLGALSSPIWENILQPLFIFVYKAILYISILGINSYKNSLYLDISQGFHENLSLRLYLLIVTLFVGFICTDTLLFFVKYKKFVDPKTKKLHNHADVSWIKKVVDRRFWRFSIILYLVFAIAFFTVDAIRAEYVNSTITYYRQSITTIRPFISNQEYLILESEFNQIKSKEDYVILLNKLEKIANKNHIKLTKLDFIF